MLLLTVLLACDPAASDRRQPDDTSPPPDPMVIDATEAVTDGDGVLRFEFDVADGMGAMQIAVTTDASGYLATGWLKNPDGDKVFDWTDWYNSDESLTEAMWATEFATVLNWPVREEDGDLPPGTWKIEVGSYNNSGYANPDVPVVVNVLQRPEPDFARGTLAVFVAYAEGLGDDAEITAGVEAAVAHWEEIYAAFGITLVPTYADIPVDPDMPDTYKGQDEYQTFLEENGGRAVLMVVGDTIANDAYIYGEAGGIPGAYVPTPAAAVEVSWLAHVGGNGKLSDNEILLMGETMAHEVGHYLGLFHPVEMGWDWFDAIGDTPRCDSMNECEGDLADNLMFPYPVCSDGECVRQTLLSGGQQGVANRYVGVE